MRKKRICESDLETIMYMDLKSLSCTTNHNIANNYLNNFLPVIRQIENLFYVVYYTLYYLQVILKCYKSNEKRPNLSDFEKPLLKNRQFLTQLRKYIRVLFPGRREISIAFYEMFFALLFFIFPSSNIEFQSLCSYFSDGIDSRAREHVGFHIIRTHTFHPFWPSKWEETWL